MLARIANLGRWGINLSYRLGQSGVMMYRVVTCRPKLVQGYRMLCDQIVQVGVLSLLIILMSALFMIFVENFRAVHGQVADVCLHRIVKMIYTY